MYLRTLGTFNLKLISKLVSSFDTIFFSSMERKQARWRVVKCIERTINKGGEIMEEWWNGEKEGRKKRNELWRKKEEISTREFFVRFFKRSPLNAEHVNTCKGTND